jgi:FtsH-binding integral membrane protein
MTDRYLHPELGGSLTAAEVAIVDQGLRAYMRRVYAYMALGLAAAGFAALVTDRLAVAIEAGLAAGRLTHGLMLTSVGHAAVSSEFKWLLVVAPFGIVVVIGLRVERMGHATSEGAFLGFASLAGASFDALFMILTETSGAPVFFAGAAAFSALVLASQLGQREPAWPTRFAIMFLSGTLIACGTAAALPESAGQPAASVAGVAFLAGLTAVAGGRLKNEYVQRVARGGVTEEPAIKGALALCLDVTGVGLLLPLLGRDRPGRTRPAGRNPARPIGS